MRWLVAPMVLAAGCDTGERVMQASPSHASMFGEVQVTITGDLAGAGNIQDVIIGGVHAIDLEPMAGGIMVRVQGAPQPGAAEIDIDGDAGHIHNGSAFSYDAVTTGAPLRWMAFGASLTEGFQSAGLDEHAQLAGYSSQIARQAGVYLAPALMVDDFVPPLQISAFVTDCATAPSLGVIAAALLTSVQDPSTHETNLALGRRDATLATQDPAVGGATVNDILNGMLGPNSILDRVVELPDGDPTLLFAPPTHSQIARVVAFDPDVAFSADFLANDAMPAVLQSDDLHPEMMTAPSTLAPLIDQVISQLGPLHGQYFIANLMDVTLLPAVTALEQQRIAAGTDTQQSFQAKITAVQSTIAAYNMALSQSAGRFPNIHVVDLATQVTSTLSAGLDVNGVHLTAGKFGGLLSLDHVHFSDTGYALIANFMITSLNAALKTTIPTVDLGTVLSTDPFSPANLAAAGVHCN